MIDLQIFTKHPEIVLVSVTVLIGALILFIFKAETKKGIFEDVSEGLKKEQANTSTKQIQTSSSKPLNAAVFKPFRLIGRYRSYLTNYSIPLWLFFSALESRTIQSCYVSRYQMVNHLNYQSGVMFLSEGILDIFSYRLLLLFFVHFF